MKLCGVPRNELFITTKLAPGGFGTPFKTFDTTISSCMQSLKNLDCEYIDLYLIHHAFAKEERLNQWRALIELQRRGVVKHIGVSNWNENHINEIIAAGLQIPSVNQIEIHPLCCQSALITYLKTHSILPVAYSSLAPLSSWRSDTPDRSLKGVKELNFDREHEVFKKLALKYSVTESRLLLRWAIQHGYPIIPKSSHHDRIVENFNLLNFELSSEDMNELDSLDSNSCLAWPSGNPLNCD